MSEEPPIDVPGSWIRRQVIPVRYLDEVIAVIERDTSSMVGREGSLLETAYVDAADDLFQMVADGTFPPHEHPGEMHTGPRAGDGLLRLDADGKVVYVSPNALSAYHRLAYNGEVLGQDLAALTRPLIDDPFDAAELADRIDGAVHGRASLRMEVEARAATVLFRALPLRPHGRPSGRAGAGPGRDRGASAGPGAAVQGRHHPGDPSPGEEQPADGGRAAADAGPTVRRSVRAAGAERIGAPGGVHRAGARDAVDLAGRPGGPGPDRRPAGADDLRRRRRGDLGTGAAGRHLRHPGRRAGHPAGDGARRGRAERAAARLRAAQSRPATVRPGHHHRRSGRPRSSTSSSPTTGSGLPDGFSWSTASGLGLQIVRTLVEAELLGTIEMGIGDGEPPAAVTDRSRDGAAPLGCVAVHIVVPLRGSQLTGPDEDDLLGSSMELAARAGCRAAGSSSGVRVTCSGRGRGRGDA